MPLDISENLYPSLRKDIVRGIHCGIFPAHPILKFPMAQKAYYY